MTKKKKNTKKSSMRKIKKRKITKIATCVPYRLENIVITVATCLEQYLKLVGRFFFQSKKIDVEDFIKDFHTKSYSSIAKLSWMPFEEAREIVRAQKFNNITEFRFQ